MYTGEYAINQCQSTDGDSCIQCQERLYSCVGLPDGDNAIEGKAWGELYIQCFRNRTLSTKQCTAGIFDPVKRHCVRQIDLSKL